MKKIEKKTYIQPNVGLTDYDCLIMQVPESLPQGNGDDPIVDDEDDILSKDRKGGWGDLW